MNKLNFRTRAKCMHRVFGPVESTDYFTCKKIAQDYARQIALVPDTVGVIYLEKWTGKEWKVIETTHF